MDYLIVVSTSHLPMVTLNYLSSNSEAVDTSIDVGPDCTWSLSVGRDFFNHNESEIFTLIPSRLTSINTVQQLLSFLSYDRVCVGNPDDKFKCLCDKHNGIFKDRFGKSINDYIYPYT